MQYFDCHNRKIGSALVIDSGYMRSLVLHVQRSQIRKSLLRLDPKNNSLKWGTVTIQKKNLDHGRIPYGTLMATIISDPGIS